VATPPPGGYKGRVLARIVDKQVGPFRVQGFSLAGEETVIALPELNVCFDAGKAPQEIIALDYLLLSHGHMDHAAGIAYYFSQRNFLGLPAGTALAPEPLVRPIRQLMRVWADIEGHPSPHRVVAARPGEDVEIRKGLLVRPFAVHHGSPSCGYAIVEVRHKLRSEYAGLSSAQIVELKRQNVAITRRVEVPLAACCGDTAPGTFLDLDCVRNASLLLLECTFFEPDHVRRAKVGYHIHVNDLPAIVEKLNCEHIVLTHVSRRTGLRRARKAIEALLPRDQCERISFLMQQPRPGRPSGDEPSR